MEIIVILLIVALSLASGSKKKKQQQARSAKASSLPVQKASASTRDAIARTLAELDRWDPELSKTRARKRQTVERDAEQEEAREKTRRRAAAEKLQTQPGGPVGAAVLSAAQGGSAVDAEGCVGGSLPHDHAEGESREEHARHIAAMEARDRAEAPQEARNIDVRQLRRAVVMAEILDRPKALRVRRGA